MAEALPEGTSGLILAQYDPFGLPVVPANSLSQPMQFSTKPYDEETGLSYYGYRFYAPGLVFMEIT